MKKACLVVEKLYQKNRIFAVEDVSFNRDNCLMPFEILRKSFASRGFELSTQDICPIDLSEIVIYFDVPAVLPPVEQAKKSFLLIYESEMISPKSGLKDMHGSFKKVFTYNDDFLDEARYIKSNLPICFSDKVTFDPSKKTRFCCMIAGNKKINHNLELYSKRVEAIRWFEQNHPEYFDLYGIGWNELLIKGQGFLSRHVLLNPIKKVLDIFAPKYPSYKGTVVSKLETLKQYKFSICYENARDIPGYITEKIFDCFFAGCIPVYWGANNITDHIPKECFIDKRKFARYEDLFDFMRKLSDEQCKIYVQAINKFLKSPAGEKFSVNYFGENIAKEVLKAINPV